MELSPEEYINRKIENVDHEKDAAILKKLRIPYSNFEFSESGAETIRVNNLDIQFSYKSLEIPNIPLRHAEVVDKTTKGEDFSWEETLKGISLAYKEAGGNPATDFKLIENLVLQNDKGKWSMQDLNEELRVVTSRMLLLPNIEYFDVRKNWAVLLGSSLFTLEGLIVAFHEFGHYASGVANPEEGKRFSEVNQKIRSFNAGFSKEPPTSEDGALLLKGERDAWAYALHTIRPFMEDLGLEFDDLKTFKKGALENYSLTAHMISKYFQKKTVEKELRTPLSELKLLLENKSTILGNQLKTIQAAVEAAELEAKTHGELSTGTAQMLEELYFPFKPQF